MDALFEKASNPEQALAAIKSNRGHLAGAYLRLLRFMVQHQTGLRYAWAEPSFSKPHSRAITEKEAGPLVSAFSGVSNLGAESVDLVGVLEKADVVSGAWRIAAPEGTYSGGIKQGGPSLEGLKIGSAYRFSCIEKRTEEQEMVENSAICILSSANLLEIVQRNHRGSLQLHDFPPSVFLGLVASHIPIVVSAPQLKRETLHTFGRLPLRCRLVVSL